MNQQVLSDEQIEAELEHLDVAWSHIPGEGLVRVVQTNGYGQGLIIVNQIAKVAEGLSHFPELTLRSDEVALTTTTEDAGGVTMQDIELARAIDQTL